ncbi:UFD1-domain-containing protein [Rhizoclosmatium globosum]|uniref:UFD1-domain-containing protein n=1 Tax=Rhizoclosmatium globosum TaxID=329046 RepID=A0A1Y2CF60_9FUNG|nr:UFD1-domain-containing protein [Rhizoclosmatium globosum]|eukprot:ORY45691.1 UFD1-domain-containing protein [Rhizoclosmatium globosum]
MEMDWMAGGGMPHMSRRGFNEYYRCYSMNMLPGNEREGLNYGGKILLPPSALAKLSTLNIACKDYMMVEAVLTHAPDPMLFEITNEQHKERHSHAVSLNSSPMKEKRTFLNGFVQPTCFGYLRKPTIHPSTTDDANPPHRRRLPCRIKNVSLPLGQFVKLQPQSVDFLEITDPKAVLEKAIGQFACLTQGDIITIKYNSTLYDILIMESKPGGRGLVSLKRIWRLICATGWPADSMSSLGSHTVVETKGFSAFHGAGQRLNGKANAKLPTIPATSDSKAPPAALHLPHGKLFFGYPIIPLKKPGDEAAEPEIPKFTGAGQTLRAAKKK